MNSNSTFPSLGSLSEALESPPQQSKTILPALQALISLSEGDSGQNRTILSPAFASMLVKYLEYSEKKRSTNVTSSDPSEALLILNNLLRGNANEIKVVLKAPDFMKKLFILLESQENDIRKQVFEVLSKISSRSSLLGYVIENPDYIEKIKKMVSNENSENRKEAAEILFNATKCANISQCIVLSEYGVLECLHALTKQDTDRELHEFGRVGVINCAKTYNACVNGIFGTEQKKSLCHHSHCKKKAKKFRK